MIQVYPINHIVTISHDSVYYLNNDKMICEFSLFECSKNWVDHVNDNFHAGKNFDDNICVAQRDWYSKEPYFEFFTNDKIRFVITPQKRIFDVFNKDWTHRYYNEFNNISKRLHNVGWTTYDLG